MINFLSQPWPWYVAGPVIALVMFSLLLSGGRLGISSNLRSICSILGAGKNCDFFDFDWKRQSWNLVFVVGMALGGFIASSFLSEDVVVSISATTQAELNEYGISTVLTSLSPTDLFSWESLLTVRGFLMMVIGGFFVGFGTRYAGGCTSGHAISGLSDLQLPSLIAVVGFFIGGLFITYFILPTLFNL